MIRCKEQGYEALSSKEWIVTNGIGGYASSTIIGTNTRRYHGVLVASFNPPTERKVLVSKVEEIIYHNGTDINLSTNRYTTGIHPEGFRHVEAFTRKPLPCTYFSRQNVRLEKTTFMVHGSNTTVIEYRNTSSEAYLLKMYPHYVNRDYHGLWHEQANFDFLAKHKNNGLEIYAYYGAEPLFFSYSGATHIENRYWNKNFEYVIDKERGQDHTEDLYTLGHVELMMQPGAVFHLVFSLDEKMLSADGAKLKKAELERLEKLVPEGINDEFLRDLIVSGDQFIVQRRTTDNYSVIAGYHWFTDWGRDSMIAIRGLAMATGKETIARSVISTFLSYLKGGIIPNRFPDYKGDMAEYNTADATLWLFVALYEYCEKTGDVQYLREVFPQLTEIIGHHVAGTFHNIRVTERGLLSQGAPHIQLTWMDARINDKVFTPREGCPVEINALWYNTLMIYEHACGKLKEKPEAEFVEVRKKLESNFIKAFWNRDGYLNDVAFEPRGADSAVRPNQVFAVSLPFSVLGEKEQRFVVESVRKNLLTPYGLRTLDVHHPEFRPKYEGDLWSRDSAYHQGTVWPFLLPEYLFAFLKVNKYSDQAKEQVAQYLQPLKSHFYNEGCIHGIAEIFDGLQPREGKGCAQQAWSVSNLILLIVKAGIKV
jgi:predicted glycogen debranching enzyme